MFFTDIAVPVAAEIFDSMWFNLQYNDTAVVFSHLLSFCDLLGFSTQNTSMPTKRVVFYFQNEKCTINCGRSLHSTNTDNKNKGYPPSCMKISTNTSTPNKHDIACASITPLQLHCFQWLHFVMKTRAWGWSQPLSLPVRAVAQHSIADENRRLCPGPGGAWQRLGALPARRDRARKNLACGKVKGGGVKMGDHTGKRNRDWGKSHWEEQLEGQEKTAAKCWWMSNPWWFKASVHQLSSYSEDQHVPVGMHRQALPIKCSETAL